MKKQKLVKRIISTILAGTLTATAGIPAVAVYAGNGEITEQQEETQEKIQEEPKIQIREKEQITVEQNEEEGKFRVMMGTLPSPEEIKELRVAVWSEVNGQDDLRWYPGKLDEDGLWYADVDCKDHGYDTGTYIVHVYVRNLQNQDTFLGGVRTEIRDPLSDVSLKAVLENDQSGAQIVLEGVRGGLAGELEACVWSRTGGQDDLKRYPMVKEGKDWRTAFAVRDHKYSTGIYDVHIYYRDKNKSRMVAGKAVSIQEIQGENLQVTSCDVVKGEMKLAFARVESPAKLKSVKAAVWNEKNGQDDLIWYEMKENKTTGGWETTAALENHGHELGMYNIHVYASDERGITQCIKTMTYQAAMKLSAEVSLNESQDQVTVTVDPKTVAAGVKGIRFAVWSEVNGQDDLKWYVFDDTYEKKINIRDHKNGTGKYFVHIYAAAKKGGETFAGGAAFQVEGITGSGVKITKTDEKEGKLRVSAGKVKSPAEINRVRFAVWTEANGQDDLCWYQGTENDGEWTVEIDTYAHNYESGKYNIHVYARDGRGMESFVGGIGTEFVQDLSSVALSFENDRQNNRLKAVLTDPKVGKDVKEVQFAVWSNVNGQDDLYWYPAQKEADGTWSREIETSAHKNNSGIYHVHAYGILENGGRRCLKTGMTMVLNNWKPQVLTKKITIEELEKEHNFLFLADTHVIVPDAKDQPEVQALGKSRIPYFKNSSGMNSEEQFPYWAEYINTHALDGVLLGGDIIDYPSESNLKYLKDELKKWKVPYLYTMGNHDAVYPWDETSAEYRPMFDELMKGSAAAQIMEYEEMVVLAVDNSSYQVLPEALAAAKQALAMGKPVVLMMHIPLQTDSLYEKVTNSWGEALMIGPDAKQPNAVTQEFLDLILAEDSPVRAVVTGHVHMEDTSMLNERITQYVVDMSARGKGVVLQFGK